MTTDNQNSPAEKAEESLISKLTDKRYVTSAEAIEILGIDSTRTLKSLRAEKSAGGRRFTQDGKEWDVPLSVRAGMLPEPEGEVFRTLVWDRAALLAIAEEFKAAKVVRAPRKKKK
ncbi:hypothetical protein [Leucobacter chromiireducens]|uniref:hypothetical protein n=1 Tax=Leucobacter chromiireducens TaxID=283877 RepID=UPI003F7E9C8B